MNEQAEIDADAVRLRDMIALLRAIGAVAIGVAAVSREAREWQRNLSNRRARRNREKSRAAGHASPSQT